MNPKKMLSCFLVLLMLLSLTGSAVSAEDYGYAGSAYGDDDYDDYDDAYDPGYYAEPTEDYCPDTSDGRHIWTEWDVLEDATCEGQGQRIRYCQSCLYRQVEYIPATGHVFGGWQTVEEPTCVSYGIRQRTCTVCGTTFTEDIPPSEHSYGEWQVTKAADCRTEGSRQRTCTVCGDVQTETIAKTDHVYGEWQVTKAADCRTEGSRQRTCTVCGYAQTETVPKADHKFGEWKITVEATDHSQGTRERVCSVCDEKETQNFDPEGTLRRGDNNEAVREMQQLLIEEGILGEGGADGAFGPGTEAAVIAFQEKEGLTPDGVLWPQTQERLRKGKSLVRDLSDILGGPMAVYHEGFYDNRILQLTPQGIISRKKTEEDGLTETIIINLALSNRGEEDLTIDLRALNGAGYIAGLDRFKGWAEGEKVLAAGETVIFPYVLQTYEYDLACGTVRRIVTATGTMEYGDTLMDTAYFLLPLIGSEEPDGLDLTYGNINRNGNGTEETITVDMKVENHSGTELPAQLFTMYEDGSPSAGDSFENWPKGGSLPLKDGTIVNFRYILKPTQEEIDADRIVRLVDVEGTDPETGTLFADEVIIDIPLNNNEEGPILHMQGSGDPASMEDPSHVYHVDDILHINADVSNRGNIPVSGVLIMCEKQTKDGTCLGRYMLDGQLPSMLEPTDGMLTLLEYPITPEDEMYGEITFVFWAEGHLEDIPEIPVFSYNQWTCTVHVGGAGDKDPEPIVSGKYVSDIVLSGETGDTGVAGSGDEDNADAGVAGDGGEDNADAGGIGGGGEDDADAGGIGGGGEEDAEDDGTLVVVLEEVGGSKKSEGYSLGEYVNFRITVMNTHDYDVKGIRVYDSYGGEAPDVVGVTDLGPQSSAVFDYPYCVTQEDVDNKGFTDEAYVRVELYYDENGVERGAYTIFSDSLVIDCCQEPDPVPELTDEISFTVEKEDYGGPADPKGYHLNEILAFKITVTNTCKSDLVNLQVSDDLKDYPDMPEYLGSVSLSPGQSVVFTYTHKVTQQDIEKTKIENQAVASTVVMGPDNEPVQMDVWSDLVTVDTIYDPFDVTPTPTETPGETPGPTPTEAPEENPEPTPTETPDTGIPAKAEGDHCSRVLKARGEGVSEYELLYCSEHQPMIDQIRQTTEQAETDEEKLTAWRSAKELLIEAVRKEYKVLYGSMAAEEDKETVKEEYELFFRQLESFEAVTALGNDELTTETMVCRLLIQHCVDLCYENAAAPAARTDSILKEDIVRLEEAYEPGETCAVEIEEEEQKTKYRFMPCGDHLKLVKGLDASLAEENADIAACFGQAKIKWKDVLKKMMVDRYLSAGPEERKLITADIRLFDDWLAKREQVLNLRYDHNDAVVAELMTAAVQNRVLAAEQAG